MSNAESSGSGREEAFGAGMASMLAFFMAALDSNRALLSSLNEFPQASAKTGERIGGDVGRMNVMNMPMEAIVSGWKIFGDAMQAAFAGVSRGQDDAAARMSQSIATAFRNFTGMDQNDILGGLAGDWSPKHVAFRSFGLGDSDALAMSAEMVELAAASGETARAMLSLYGLMSESWMKAARAFSETDSARAGVPSDPAQLQRAWAATAEPILQETLRSEAFLKANAEFIRIASRQAKARSALARRFTDFIEAPHRQEMNETYEAIQELRREIRTLKRGQARLEKALAVPAAP
jgi:hypothetical protein